MATLGDDFNVFFKEMTGELLSPSGIVSLVKTTHPPQASGAKTKPQGTSSSRSKGNLRARKKKVWFCFPFPNDLSEGVLDLIANEMVSHMAHYIYYFVENITLENAMETDRLRLGEHYSRVLRAS